MNLQSEQEKFFENNIEFKLNYLDFLFDKENEEAIYWIYNLDDIIESIDVDYGSDFINFSFKGCTIGLIKFTISNNETYINFTWNININNLNEIDWDLINEYDDIFWDNYMNISIKWLWTHMYKILYEYLISNNIKFVSWNEYSDKIWKINNYMLENWVLSKIINNWNESIRYL